MIQKGNIIEEAQDSCIFDIHQKKNKEKLAKNKRREVTKMSHCRKQRDMPDYTNITNCLFILQNTRRNSKRVEVSLARLTGVLYSRQLSPF